VIILSRLGIFAKKETVERVIDFQGGEVLKVLLNALYRQDLFNKGLVPYLVGSLSDPFGVPPSV
jgi:hypothetical protein